MTQVEGLLGVMQVLQQLPSRQFPSPPAQAVVTLVRSLVLHWCEESQVASWHSLELEHARQPSPEAPQAVTALPATQVLPLQQPVQQPPW